MVAPRRDLDVRPELILGLTEVVPAPAIDGSVGTQRAVVVVACGELRERTGSDTIMVAPVTIGDGAMTGAGSVISKDVPPGALAVERTEQRTVEGYRHRKDAPNPARTAKGE